MNQMNQMCQRCKNQFKPEQLDRVSCVHLYCKKCIELYQREGGGDCKADGCKEYLRIDQLMGGMFTQFQKAQFQITGQGKQQQQKNFTKTEKSNSQGKFQPFQGTGVQLGGAPPNKTQQFSNSPQVKKQTIQNSPQVNQQKKGTNFQQQQNQQTPQIQNKSNIPIQQKQPQQNQQTVQQQQKQFQVVQLQQQQQQQQQIEQKKQQQQQNQQQQNQQQQNQQQQNQQQQNQQQQQPQPIKQNDQLNELNRPPQLNQQQKNPEPPQPAPPKLQRKESEIKLCSVCNNRSEALYQNEACLHYYCYECMKKGQTDVCFVKDCGWQINKEWIEDFLLAVEQFKKDNNGIKQKEIVVLEDDPIPSMLMSAIDDHQDSQVMIQSVPFQEVNTHNITAVNLNQFVCMFDEIKIKQIQFVDPDFRPNQQSLGRFNFGWARVTDIFGGDYQFFSKDATGQNRLGLAKWIGPDDIKQGALGNCYLLASIAAIGNRRPDLLVQNFVTQTINEQGIYGVRFCLNGVWRVICIDDFFPVCYGRPAFSKSRNNAIWVMVIEKAWAKLFGSYSASAAGSMQEVMKALTGAPTEIIWTAQDDFLIELRKKLQEKVIMVAATQTRDIQPITQGLVPNHAYSILKIKTVNHPQRKNLELIKLRNPWGHQEWQGDWSYDSPLWTALLRKEMKLDEDNSGVFYMDVGSFMQHFRDIHVCHVRDNHFYEAQEVRTTKRNAAYFQFDIEKAGEYFVSINQKNKRFPKNPQEYSWSKILIIKKNGNSFDIISGKTSQHIEVWTKATLLPGSYVVYAKTIWEKQDSNVFGLSIYGPSRVNMVRTTNIQRNILHLAYTRIAQAQEPKKDFGQMGQPQVKSCFFFDRITGFGYYYLENNSNKIARINIHFDKFRGLKLRKPDRGNGINVELDQKRNQIFIFKVSNQGYEFAMTTKASFY